ncbi:MAG: transposase [Verrucomicrobia bacterium]|nr:transposase [Verrucomicrobiota bacterium]
MPRANRYIVAGQVYHITHRCHDRKFLLKFARDRNVYREWLRDALKRHPVLLLGYCITLNHVHLVLHSETEAAVGRFMQLVEGSVAQQYNIRKERSGGFWSERYHATMIDSGRYLRRCLQYVDLNMVRAGAVTHPRDWDWGGYRETAGLRKRYLLLDVDKLAEQLGFLDISEFRKSYTSDLDEVLAKEQLPRREPMWTESLAVGSESFVNQMVARFTKRRELEVRSEHGVWLVKEAKASCV